MRGYVTTYDAETGKQLWRFYTVPGEPAKGFENPAMKMAAKTWKGEWWKNGGGGAVWNAITYDPKYNRVYLGIGNGIPWNRVRSRAAATICPRVPSSRSMPPRGMWYYQVPRRHRDFDLQDNCWPM
jgi:glucose dehydrogenase